MAFGVGVLLNLLSGRDDESLAALEKLKGSLIMSVSIDKTGDDALVFKTNRGVIRLFDDERWCCESRYMTCDDDLRDFEGAEVLEVEIRDAEELLDEYGDVHEQQFLLVTTSKGVITACTHNEHNGYYGGFSLKARLKD